MRLLVSKTWELRYGSGAVQVITWNADQSLCLRLSRRDAACFDTGRWQLENGQVCYEFARFGASTGINKGCFKVLPTSAGTYEQLWDHGRQEGNITVID